MKIPTSEELQEFLRESNAIEGIYDDDSLIQAARAWEYLIAHERLSEAAILRTHKILMLNQNGLHPDQKGYFRKVNVQVGGYVAIPHEKVNSAMRGWIALANNFTHDWKNLHVAFEEIHPFVDGNGRIGRMLMNWQRLQFKVPLLILKAENRGEYYKWFRKP